MTSTINSLPFARTPGAHRIEALDWLRGLMALSIMLFHLGTFGYLGGPFDTSKLLGRLGIYGVAIFFVLSGLSIAIGYDRYLSGVKSLFGFIIRRFFRIWPLLWLAIAYAVILDTFQGNHFSWILIVANMTTLFSFIKPYAYINMGAWSIGNEIVYYTITPLFVFAYRYGRLLGNVLTLITIFIGLLFCFHFLVRNVPLERQWRIYINPFNNMFLYCCGMSLYYNFRDYKAPPWIAGFLLLLVFVVFLFYPVQGDQIHIVTGINRVVFSTMAIILVFLAYTTPPQLPAFLAKPMEQLGLATYGVYLLHPIIISILTILLAQLGIESEIVFPVLVIILTIAVALTSFRYFEMPLVKLGKNLTRVSGKYRWQMKDSSL